MAWALGLGTLVVSQVELVWLPGLAFNPPGRCFCFFQAVVLATLSLAVGVFVPAAQHQQSITPLVLQAPPSSWLCHAISVLCGGL